MRQGRQRLGNNFTNVDVQMYVQEFPYMDKGKVISTRQIAL